MSEEFKSLAGLLLAPDAAARPTMADVLGHPWMRGEAATHQDFTAKFNHIMQRAVDTRDGGQEALDVDFQIAGAGRRQNMRGGGGKGDVDINKEWAMGREFRPVVPPRLGQQCTTFTVLGDPLEIMGALRDVLSGYSAKDADLTLSKRAWRATVTAKMKFEPMEIEGEDMLKESSSSNKEESKDATELLNLAGPGAEI